ncbi:hypothetical protein GCM10027051_31300 [Niabella terrae]
MQQHDKIVPFGLLNTDDAPHFLPEGDVVNMRNLRLINTKDGKNGYLENIHSTTLMPEQDEIPEGSITVARYEDPQNRFVIWFTHVPGTWSQDRINYYDLKYKRYWLVAKSGIYDDDGEIIGGLRFYTGVHYTLKVVGTQLVWVCYGIQPMKIDIGAAIKTSNPLAPNNEIPFYKGWKYDWNAEDSTEVNLRLICKPPGIPPIVTKFTNPDFQGNNIGTESYQFATMFQYFTGEESSLSPFSTSTQINSRFGEQFNAISVTLDPYERPFPQGVEYIKLYIKVFSTDKMFLLHKWKIADIADDQTITYEFNGLLLGEALSDDVVNEPYHSVPLSTSAMEYAKGRLMLGDNLSGYDTPTTTSLTLSTSTVAVEESPTNASRPLYRMFYRGNWKAGKLFERPRYYYSGLYVFMKANERMGGEPEGYYLIAGTELRYYEDYNGIPPRFAAAPTSVALTNLTFKGKNANEIKDNTLDKSLGKLYEIKLYPDYSKPIEIIGLPAEEITMPPTEAFLHYSDYSAGVVFYDRFLRKCGVVTKDSCKVTTPIRQFSITEVIGSVDWALTNDNAYNEIPEWAEYYAPVISKNNRALTHVTGYASDIRYAVLGENGGFKADDGLETGDVENDDTPFREFSRFTAGIAVDASSLVNAGLGYSFTEGDMAILLFKDSATSGVTTYHLPVIGQAGKYIILGAKKLKATLLNVDECIYELYTPNKLENPDFYYETGQMYKIIDPGAVTRTYSAMEGKFLPDGFILDRTTGSGAYRGYAMSPNDLFWKKWVTHRSRVNAVIETGQTSKPNEIAYSDVYLEGATVNGLSRFHALNFKMLPEELGRIRSLTLTSRAQKEGSVMLAIGDVSTASVYMGEVELMDGQGDAFVAKSQQVIGTINVLRGEYGTVNPESVVVFDGAVFWFDSVRKAFIRYNTNGLFPISKYKFERGTWLLTEHIRKQTSLGNMVQVHGGVDPYYKEYLVQRRVIIPEPRFFCEGVEAINISADPSTDAPNRVKVEWVFNGGSRSFDWKYMNRDGLVVNEGRILNVTSPHIQYIEQPPTDGEDQFYLEFRGRANCGGGNYSRYFKQEFAFSGTTETGEPPACSPLVSDDLLIPETLYVGYGYHAVLGFFGTGPATLSSVVKPTFLDITVSGTTVSITSNTAITSSMLGWHTISFDLDNCASEPVSFEKIIQVKTKPEPEPEPEPDLPGGHPKPPPEFPTGGGDTTPS